MEAIYPPMQVIYQIISAYFEDDCADELTNEPVMTAILDKDALASQPTLSRFLIPMEIRKEKVSTIIIRQAHGAIRAELFLKSKSLMGK